MSIKWIALLFAVACAVPMVLWLRRNPKYTPWLWVLVGILPFVVDPMHWYMAVISWAGWPGYVKGLEITATDLVVLLIFITTPPPPAKFRRYPFFFTMAFYIFAVLLSAYHSDFPTATYFSVWQLIRMLTLSVVLARACANEHVPPALMAGLAIGICLEVVLTLTQHGEGVTQAMGQFAHQNLLGLIANSVVMIFLGVYIAKPTAWKLAIVPFAGMIMAVLTASRATLGLYLMGVILLFLLSMIRQYTNQKFWIALVCTMLLAISTPFALSTLAARFAAQPLDEGYDERAAFQAAATLMINDHPLGVGANNYVLVVNLKGYNDRAMVAPVVGSRSANVHNVYYLVTAEIGWFGLFAFVIMLLHPLIVAFRCGWRNRHDLRGDMLIGLGVSMFVTYCHSWFEWIFVAHEAQYFFAIICGLTAGMAMQLDYFAPVRKAVPRLSDGTRTISDATVTI